VVLLVWNVSAHTGRIARGFNGAAGAPLESDSPIQSKSCAVVAPEYAFECHVDLTKAPADSQVHDDLRRADKLKLCF
jgi:hypothetical protein